jgi:hypothetical protein
MVEQGDKFGGWNSIHTACYYGQDKVLKYLIDTAQPNLELLVRASFLVLPLSNISAFRTRKSVLLCTLPLCEAIMSALRY